MFIQVVIFHEKNLNLKIVKNFNLFLNGFSFGAYYVLFKIAFLSEVKYSSILISENIYRWNSFNFIAKDLTCGSFMIDSFHWVEFDGKPLFSSCLY